VPSMAIIDNVVPYIDGEEEKVEFENLKILGELDEEKDEVKLLPAVFSASCHRVPTLYGHLEALFVEFENVGFFQRIRHCIPAVAGFSQVDI